MDYNILHQGLCDFFNKQRSTPQEFACAFANVYTNFAITAVPTPILAGHSDSMIISISGNMIEGIGPTGVVNAIVSGITVFWQGVLLAAGGGVIAFLGAQSLSISLFQLFSMMRSSQEAAGLMADALYSATGQVQYVIPPSPPAFLI